jgi:bacillopeptidase F
MLFIFGGLGLFVIFMAVFGLNFLINIGVWFNGLVSSEPEEVQAREEFFGTLFVNTPPAATNSASIIISGNTTEFNTVTFIINDEEVKEAEVLNADSFTEKIGSLKPGVNTVQVIATATKQKQTKESEVFNVKYINTKPKIAISEPADGTEITKDEIVIKGSTDKNNSVEVNGAPVVVSATGAFEEEVRLKEGENSIEVLAIDEAGNEEKIELKINYKKE